MAADAAGDALTVTPIGVVRGGREQADDDRWGGVEAVIELDANRFGPDAVAGLEDFSHLEVVYLFHLVDEATINVGVRRPRGNPEWPEVGIFAQRAKGRRQPQWSGELMRDYYA